MSKALLIFSLGASLMMAAPADAEWACSNSMYFRVNGGELQQPFYLNGRLVSTEYYTILVNTTQVISAINYGTFADGKAFVKTVILDKVTGHFEYVFSTNSQPYTASASGSCQATE